MRKLLLLISICWFGPLVAQNTIALPEMINYSRKVYNAGTQNWNIRQDKNGILYFANNEGLLSFDGTYWKTYSLPNRSIVRSIEIAPDGRIYVGGQQEFGFFFPDKKGELRYTSLVNLIPGHDQEFADVWNIVLWRGQVFFRSGKRIFHFNDGKISAYNSIHWSFIGTYHDVLVAKDFHQGLLQFQNGVWTPFSVNGQQIDKEMNISALLPLSKDTVLLTTLKHGLFFITPAGITPFRNPTLDAITAHSVYSATLTGPHQIALGTSRGGCYIISDKGQLIQRFAKPDGLQNNNILSIYVDRDRNIWLGLDNGIDFIAYGKAIKHISPEPGDVNSGYVSYIFNKHLYIGTSVGLYQVPLAGNDPDLGHTMGSFKLVPNSVGQVWNLNDVNGVLLMGHNDGAFLVTPDAATTLDNTSGFWGFQPCSPIQPSSVMMAGSYNGINFYSFENGRFVNHGVHTHFESARYICVDDNAIWVAHPYKGLFKVQFNPPALPTNTHYKDVAGILSLNRNYLYKIKSRIVLTTEKGIYEYNAAKDTFELSPYFHKLFGNLRVQYLKEDPSGNIWFIQDKKLGVIDLSEATPHTIFFPELNNKITGNGYEHIYPYNEQNIFIAAEEGFYLINYSQYIQNKPQLHILLRTVKAIAATDSLLSGGYTNGEVTTERFPHQFNAFRFQYASPYYDQQNNIEYSYFLEGLDEKWSDWSKRSEKDYTALHPGLYRFRVKARSQPGQESPEVQYAFRVLPPWYLSEFAYCFYALLFAYGVYYLYRRQNKKFRRQQKRHEEEQKRLQYMHQLEIDRSEKEIMLLRNEKLEAEIEHKNAALASSAMHLVQKGELITKLKDDLTRLSKNVDSEKTGDDFKKILRVLDRDTQMDSDWETFAQHFDTVHSDFLVELKNRFPQLTPNETKLCAFLRMNLSSKEIARLLNISTRGVEVSRYRLRKKLKLPTEVNLYDYLLNPDMELPPAAAPPSEEGL